jgi:hypothetical protein
MEAFPIRARAGFPGPAVRARALVNGLWEWRIGMCGPHKRWINLPGSGQCGGGGASQLLSRR